MERFREMSLAKRALFLSTASVASALTALSYTELEAPPTAVYAEVATNYDLPGADLTDNLSERRESRIRHKTIVDNKAEPFDTVRTSSGVTIEFARSGLDGTDYEVRVDERALDETVDFVIDSLDDYEQDVVDPDTIEDIQDKAAQGNLGNVSVTAIVSLESDHCIDDRVNRFIDCPTYPAPKWAIDGLTSGGNFTGKGTSHGVMLLPGNEWQLLDSLTQTEVDLLNPTHAESVSNVFGHEFVHSLLESEGLRSSSREVHEQLINPIEQEAAFRLFDMAPGGKTDTLDPIFVPAKASS